LIYPLSLGGITGTVADIKLVLSVALKTAARSIILSHHPPSGNLEPSAADKALTANIKKAFAHFDISLIDYIILSD